MEELELFANREKPSNSEIELDLSNSIHHSTINDSEEEDVEEIDEDFELENEEEEEMVDTPTTMYAQS